MQQRAWWRLYAQRDASICGQRRQYSSSTCLKDFEALKRWVLSEGYTVICVRETCCPPEKENANGSP